MIKAAIFDFFGVIASDSFDITYQELGGDPVKDHDFISNTMHAVNYGWMSSRESAEAIGEKLGVEPEAWQETMLGGVRLDPRVLNWIVILRKQYKTGLLSNMGSGGLYSWFSEEDLQKYFDVWVPSSDVGMAKPFAQVYEQTAQKLGVEPEECIFIDDRYDYCDGARLVGMKTIEYKSFHQAQKEFAALTGGE